MTDLLYGAGDALWRVDVVKSPVKSSDATTTLVIWSIKEAYSLSLLSFATTFRSMLPDPQVGPKGLRRAKHRDAVRGLTNRHTASSNLVCTG